jgi:hypothetical protein
MVLRARFEFAWGIVRGWTNPIGDQLLKVFILPIQYPCVRTEKFITRGDKEVAIQRLHIDRTMRGVLYGIDVHPGASFVRHADQLGLPGGL